MNILGLPHASAHEVYVLTNPEIGQALNTKSPNPFSAIGGEPGQFLAWGAGGLIAFLFILKFSLSPFFERMFDPWLRRLKRFAPLVARLTLGSSLIVSGYFHDLFGPELPLASLVPHEGAFLSAALIVIGSAIVLNILTRWAAAAGIVIFIIATFHNHFYMVSYVNYLGEMLLFVILGGGGLLAKLEKYAFLILRVGFGTAVFFASFYAKFLHSALALDTVNDYHLTNYFPFSPLFLVLGAFIIEALIGFCIAVGLELRFMTVLFTFFLTLSIIFFGEAVWPHIILFGVNAALFCHGYDKYTLEAKFFQRKRYGEPVL